MPPAKKIGKWVPASDRLQRAEFTDDGPCQPAKYPKGSKAEKLAEKRRKG